MTGRVLGTGNKKEKKKIREEIPFFMELTFIPVLYLSSIKHMNGIVEDNLKYLNS